MLYRMTLSIILMISCVCAIQALDSLTCRVCPGPNPPGGMGKVTIGRAELIITVGDNCSDRYIAATPALAGTGPLVMWNGPTGSNPCKPDKNRTWTWEVVVVHPNANMFASFSGAMPHCTGTSGNEDPPEFQGTVVHVDLDVDSDRTSRQCQRPPDRSDGEDAVEEAQPSLILGMNTGFDEGGAWSNEDDWVRPGIVTSDIDLVRAVFEVRGSAGAATFTYPNSIILYSSDGTMMANGVAHPFDIGEHDLLIEGISYGQGAIRVVFVPNSGIQNAQDEVAYWVKPEDRMVIGVSGLGGSPSGAWEFANAAVGAGTSQDGGIRGTSMQNDGPLPRTIRQRNSGHMIWARGATRRAIEEWMADDYTMGGTENRNIISIGNSWGAKNSTSYVEFFRRRYCKHPRAHVLVEGVDGPAPKPYPRIGPAVHKLNYYSAEPHFPSGQSIAGANQDVGFDLTITSDVHGNISNVVAVAPTPAIYLANRYRKIGTYWLEYEFSYNIHIVTEWVGAKVGLNRLKALLSQGP